MDLSSPRSISVAGHSATIFHVSQTSSLRHSELTVGTSNDMHLHHGCLVLEQESNPEDNPENIISKEVHFWVLNVALAGIVPVLFLVGVPANILSAAVFFRQGLRERINFCIFCLGIVDLVVITVSFCRSAEDRYRIFIGPSNFLIKYFVGFSGFTWVSMFLSTVIAAERCFCVVSPLRAERMLSTRTLAVIVISISVILLTGKLVIVGPKHTEACVFDPTTNSTSYILYVTEYYLNNKKIFDIISTFVYATALPVFFFVVIIITTVITTVKLQSVVRWRQQFSSASGTQTSGSAEYQMVSVTRMLIVTSVLFLVCLCPILFLQMVMFLMPELTYGTRYHNLLDVLWGLIFMFRSVNSSFNFFIYYKMGSRFRHTLRELFPCTGRNNNQSGSDCVESSKIQGK